MEGSSVNFKRTSQLLGSHLMKLWSIRNSSEEVTSYFIYLFFLPSASTLSPYFGTPDAFQLPQLTLPFSQTSMEKVSDIFNLDFGLVLFLCCNNMGLFACLFVNWMKMQWILSWIIYVSDRERLIVCFSNAEWFLLWQPTIGIPWLGKLSFCSYFSAFCILI